MKHPPGSMGSCFIWQRTAEPPSFCPAVPSFLEFKQNNDCSLIGKQVSRVLRRNSRCSASTSTQGIDSTGSFGQKQKSPLKTLTPRQHCREITCNSQAVSYAHICTYSNLLSFRTIKKKIFALLRVAQLSLFLCILKKFALNVRLRQTERVRKVLRTIKQVELQLKKVVHIMHLVLWLLKLQNFLLK